MAQLQSHTSGSRIQWKWSLLSIILLTANTLHAQQADPAQGNEPERVLAAEPQTLKERMDAILLVVKLARPELAKQYLSEILASDLTEEQLIQLRDDYGTATFLSLTNVEGLNPEASQLLDKITTAVKGMVNDSAYANKLLPKLNGTARERSEALNELRALGAAAVPPILSAIENETLNRDVLVYNLTRLGDEAVPPIIGALASDSSKIRSAASEALGRLGTRNDVIWLWSTAFAPDIPEGVQQNARQAIARILFGEARLANRVTSYGMSAKLLEAAIDYLTNQHTWGVRYEDMELIPVWTWDTQNATLIKTESTRKHAAIHYAERLAREASELSPTNEDAPVVLLAAKMVRDIEAAGWDKPIAVGPGTAHDLAVTAGPDTCNQVLHLAIDHNITGAALSAVSALGLNGSRSILNQSTPPPAIVAALDYPHPRVQFAAAVSILQWEPQKAFRGSRRVTEILARAIRSNSKRESVVIDPNAERGSTTATLFSELGFRPSVTKTGMEGFRHAASHGDVELAVLHPNTIRWELTQTIENLRSDSRTKNLPLVIYGPASLRGRFDTIQNRFQNVVYINETVSSLDVHRQLQPVFAQMTPPALTTEQRTAQISAAAYWLRWIATSASPGVFDITPFEPELIEASSNPLVADDAIVALGGIATPTAQQRFLELAESPSTDAEIRRRAALQLAFHIQRFGNLLSPAELDRVLTLAGDESQPELSTAIASVLGSLNPKPEAIRKLILDAPVPATSIPASQE